MNKGNRKFETCIILKDINEEWNETRRKQILRGDFKEITVEQRGCFFTGFLLGYFENESEFVFTYELKNKRKTWSII